jgi:nucleoside 2-deoxyribosyltransferase
LPGERFAGVLFVILSKSSPPMSQSANTQPKPFCFVLMPFDSRFDDIYNLGIKETCDQAGAYCERVDEQFYQGTILDRIYNQIAKADFIVADMTGRNPNVFYEVGYAHALGKRTILLMKDASDIPFDLKHYPHVIYGDRIGVLRDGLRQRVEWCVNNPVETAGTGSVKIEIFLGDSNLSAGDVVKLCKKNEIAHAEITLFNASSITYPLGSFKVGILTPSTYSRARQQSIRTSRLPTGELIHMLPDFGPIFPQQYLTVNFSFDEYPAKDRADAMTIRLFTSAGTRDYKLGMRGET